MELEHHAMCGQHCKTLTMTSNGTQFTVTRKMLDVVAHDRRWLDVVAGISVCFTCQILLLFCFAI